MRAEWRLLNNKKDPCLERRAVNDLASLFFAHALSAVRALGPKLCSKARRSAPFCCVPCRWRSVFGTLESRGRHRSEVFFVVLAKILPDYAMVPGYGWDEKSSHVGLAEA
jgi:hypothetical protein